MCGISGIVASSSAAVQVPAVARMNQYMAPRGPDDEGIVAFSQGRNPIVVADGIDQADALRLSPKGLDAIPEVDLVLGHRRLSVLDLSSLGHQPFQVSQGRYWMVYNGEIYNYRELAEELRSLGVSIESRCDTEVLLKSYAQWGEKCVERLLGAFAFAIWDNDKRVLFCGRDRIGVKPFYYSNSPNGFVFASNIGAILASGMVEAKPNWRGVFHSMSQGIAPRPMTCFEGITALAPGCVMTVAKGCEPVIREYWKIPIGTVEPSMTEAEATDLIEDRARAAVQRRLVSDVPVGVFLSGGIDSNLVAAMAAGGESEVTALTLTWPGDGAAEETANAKKTAERYGLKHVIHHTEGEYALEFLDEIIELYEEPSSALGPNYMISRVAAEAGLKVVLSGLGGDELFAGYRWCKTAEVWDRLGSLRPLVAALAPLVPGRYSKNLRLLNAQSADQLHSLIYIQQSDDGIREILDLPGTGQLSVSKELNRLYVGDKQFVNAIDAMGFMDLKNCVGNHHVHRFDQFTMAHSVEGRVPFLDHELVEAAFRVPSRWKIRNGVGKQVLRRIAKSSLDPSIVTMRKQGFSVPLTNWFQGAFLEKVEDAIEGLAKRPFCKGEALRAKFERSLTDPRHRRSIVHFAMLELWYRRFFENPVSVPAGGLS